MNKIDLDELYENRLLLFLENDEDYDEAGKGFRQVILTPEQFKKISDIIFEKSDFQPDNLRDGIDIGETLVGEKVIQIDTFLGMSSYKKNI